MEPIHNTMYRGNRRSIDRGTLVSRHIPTRTASNPQSPAQVGNGSFAFGADITGLQTFHPFAIMSDWGWKNDPLPIRADFQRYKGQQWDVDGRGVSFDMPDPNAPLESQWLISNPNRLNLGRIGLLLADSPNFVESDCDSALQTVDIWKGVICSDLVWKGEKIRIETRVHPKCDVVTVGLQSVLVQQGKLGIFLDFPFCDGREKFSAPYVGRWDLPNDHVTEVLTCDEQSVKLLRRIGDAKYMVGLRWNPKGRFEQLKGHLYALYPHPEQSKRLELVAEFRPANTKELFLKFDQVRFACESHWPNFWQSCGAIDLSGSTDPRWVELERRIVLSLYIMAVNCTGRYPSQESGLVNLGWRGKFHLEMIWWHFAFWGLFNRWDIFENTLEDTYKAFLPSSIERAREQGYRGARWPKMTDPSGKQGPGVINALLIWQQPHPIAFAELDYQHRPCQKVLTKWKDIVEATADFMASFPVWNKSKKQYELIPPIHLVSENTDPTKSLNPSFELTYWRFGLHIAVEWWLRMGESPKTSWIQVRDNLAPCPIDGGGYVIHEGITSSDMWSRYNFEHPALACMYGWLPMVDAPNTIDMQVSRATSLKLWDSWRLDDCWGWDFGVLAMNAARLGEPLRAIDFLLSEHFAFDDVGLATGGSRVPFPYMPSNGSLLYAAAFMAAGWTDSPSGLHAPGYPRFEEGWCVRWENLKKAM